MALTWLWSFCHEIKSKHIDWTLCLRCDQWVGPWSWPWLCIFRVKYGICYISTNNVRLPWNEKQTYWFSSGPQYDQLVWPLPWPQPLIFNVKCDLDLWPHTGHYPWIFTIKSYIFCNSGISGIGGPIDIEQKVWESAIHDHGRDLFVTMSYVYIELYTCQLPNMLPW